MIQKFPQQLLSLLGSKTHVSVYETYRLLLPMSLIWEYTFSWGIPSQFKFLQEIQSLISNSLPKKYTKTHTFLFFCFTLGLPWGKEQSGLFLLNCSRQEREKKNQSTEK